MPECPRDNQYSTLPPPGFTDTNVALKRGQLIELLKKVIDKSQDEPQFVEQQSKQVDLLISIAQFTLLPTPISSDDKRDFLNNIITIGQDLLTDENQVNNDLNKETTSSSSIDSGLSLNNNKDTPLTSLPSDTSNTDGDGDFSLADLANEYLQDEPSPPSSNDKPTTSSESEEPDLPFDELSKKFLSSSPTTPPTSVLSTLVFPPLSNEPVIIKPPLESILFSNRLSSHDAADDADCIWKEESSPLGQMFCAKTNEIETLVTKRISTCLLDYSLYERLTRLIALLPKQCIRNNVQQLSIRPNEQQYRPQRPNNNNGRPSHRPSFQQNSLQPHPTMLRYPPTQNPRQYSNSHYSNQQRYPNERFVDQRSQQQQNRYPPPSFAPYPVDYQQQQNRYPPPPFAPYPVDYQQQQKGPPKNNSYNNGPQQQKKNPPTNNQQASNQHHQQQRSTKKGSGGGGNKLNNEKSGGPGSSPSLNPK